MGSQTGRMGAEPRVQHEILMAEKLNKHVRYVPLDHLSQNDITWQNLHEELVEWSNRRNELRNA